MSQQHANCRKCGHAIVFLPTKNKKLAPVNAETVGIFDEVFDSKRHMSHFATCTAPNEFRKPRETNARQNRK